MRSSEVLVSLTERDCLDSTDDLRLGTGVFLQGSGVNFSFFVSLGCTD